jgi:peptide/nickel transport system permease protein
MLVAAIRRLFFSVLALVAATFITFVVIWTHQPAFKSRPVLPAWWHWLRGLFTGSSYHSILSQAPLWQTEFKTAIGHTAALLLVTALFMVPVSLLFAWVAARRRDGIADLTLRATSYAAWAIPSFVLSMVFALAATQLGGEQGLGPFAVFGWAGTCRPGFGLGGGVFNCPPAGHGVTYVWNVFRYLAIPSLALAFAFTGLHARHLRDGVIETFDAPFITTARAKGLSDTRILFRHVLRIAGSAFVSGILADVGAIFGATLAVDAVFGLNGLGTLLLFEFPTGFGTIDVYSLQLLLVLAGGFVLLSGVLADLVVAALDPRLRRA